MSDKNEAPFEPTEEGKKAQQEYQELLKKRRSRSIALAFVLAALVILLYIVSVIKGPGVIERPHVRPPHTDKSKDSL
jgi:hypothetical protein